MVFGSTVSSHLLFLLLDEFQAGSTAAKHWVSSAQGDKWFIGIFGRNHEIMQF